MNHLETLWRPLVQRRLLPVAILLVAALVAIPFVLAKDAAPVAPAAPAPVAGGDASLIAAAAADDSIVSLVGTGEDRKRRRVLGARKNPFEPAPAPKATATPALETTPATEAADTDTGIVTPSSIGSTAPSGGGADTTSPPPSTPPSTDDPAKDPKLYELYSLTVRFGETSSDVMEKRNLPRLKALPGADDPMLVYLGVAEDEKTAIFLVDSKLEPQGDGTCVPNPASCQTIHLRVGDTEFFDVMGETGEVVAQYQLDLLKINRSTTASATKAMAARLQASKAGRRVLRAREAAAGPLRYRYDAKSGKVRKLDRKTYRALVAHSAKVTASFSAGL
jgi:hypothetical protein